jgi:hypothetical protein
MPPARAGYTYAPQYPRVIRPTNIAVHQLPSSPAAPQPIIAWSDRGSNFGDTRPQLTYDESGLQMGHAKDQLTQIRGEGVGGYDMSAGVKEVDR